MIPNIDFLKAAGFNMIRKHLKVEPRRCDARETPNTRVAPYRTWHWQSRKTVTSFAGCFRLFLMKSARRSFPS